MSASGVNLSILVAFLALRSAVALEYEKDIMPIFEGKCFKCHSDKAEKVKGGLRLDDPKHFQGRFSKDELVTPGDPKLSGLYYSLTRPRYDKGAMPPEEKGEQLTEDEVELVRAWIAEGAPINGTRGTRSGPTAEDGKGRGLSERPPGMSKEMEWKNREGKVIMATLLRVEDEVAVLRMGDGRIYRYPIANLSDASQEVLRKLAQGKG